MPEEPRVIRDPVQLETAHIRVRVSRANGEYDLLDKRSSELWRSPRLRGWCRAGLRCADGRAAEVVRSRDSQPIEQSRRLRIYHGFGAGPICLRTLGQAALLPDRRRVVAREGSVPLQVGGVAEVKIA